MAQSMEQVERSARPLILAVTACPTGIAHTYMAAENLEAAATELGYDIKIETHGSIGVEGHFTAADLEAADAVVIAADTVIVKDRFVGKRLVATGVDEAIRRPTELIDAALHAAPLSQATAARSRGQAGADPDGTEGPDGTASAPGTAGAISGVRGVSQTVYKALMNGVSHMIPFVVTGGLLLAVALSVGGTPTPEGLAIPEDSFWYTISQLGTLAFSLMVPVLSAYIAVGIADRPGLAPGLITGLIATTGQLYGSEANAGFLGGIVTGILSGYVALAIKKIPVHKFIAPIWPIIVIPIFTTLVVGLVFIYLVGAPVAGVFSALTDYLAGMQGASVIVLGAVIGAMIAFDMGGPFNKTAFLFGGGMIAAGNAVPMGMAATAIAVPPLAVGVATLARRAWFTKAERDSGIAALFMGFFGITEGAIPLAAARPLQVIPANVLGGAAAGALAGVFSVQDHVMHGGPIVAVLGAVDNVFAYFASMAVGIAVTAALILGLVAATRRRNANSKAIAADDASSASNTDERSGPAAMPATGADNGATTATVVAPERLITAETVELDIDETDRDAVIRMLINKADQAGRIADAEAVFDAVVARENQHSTGVGYGVAIPHARCAGVSSPTLAFVRLNEPGAAWSVGEERTQLAFLIAVPEDAGKTHLKLLQKLARHLMSDEFRTELREAVTPDDAAEVVRRAID